MGLYDSYDLSFSWDGDFSIGTDGDLADNNDDAIRSLVTEIQTYIKSEFGDWEKYPNLGANLSEFRGEPNNRETSQKIEDRIRSALTAWKIVKAEDLSVKIIPVSSSQVFIMIQVQATSTNKNSLTQGDPISINFIYDSMEDSIFFLSPSKIAWEGR